MLGFIQAERVSSQIVLWCSSQGSIFFPWKQIWRNETTLRMTFFGWTVALGNNVLDILEVYIVAIDRCCMCKNGEKIDHLFFAVR